MKRPSGLKVRVHPGEKMEAAALTAQQASLQQNLSLSFVKKNAQAEQSLVNMIAQNSSPERGQNLDVTV